MANPVGNAAGAGAMGGMALGPWGALAGAGLGLLKSIFDSENEKKDRAIQSITDRYSPWTGMRGKMVEHTDPLSSAMQGGVQLAALGQGIENQAAQKTFSDAATKYLTSKAAGDSMGDSAVAAANAAKNLAAPLSSGSDIDLGNPYGSAAISQRVRDALLGRGLF